MIEDNQATGKGLTNCMQPSVRYTNTYREREKDIPAMF